MHGPHHFCINCTIQWVRPQVSPSVISNQLYLLMWMPIPSLSLSLSECLLSPPHLNPLSHLTWWCSQVTHPGQSTNHLKVTFMQHRLDQSVLLQVGFHYIYNPPEFLTWASVVWPSQPCSSPILSLLRDDHSDILLLLENTSFSSLSPAQILNTLDKGKVSLDHINPNPFISLLNWLCSTQSMKMCINCV